VDRSSAFDAARGASPDASLCPYGCYWECEHRPRPDSARLWPVHDDEGRPLRRCRECGGAFYSALLHAREHERMRMLGLLPERYPRQWPSIRRDGEAVAGEGYG
jgi:hypothetical protein